jgi:signal transduction histidine kinase
MAHEVALFHEGEKLREAHANLIAQHDRVLAKSAQLAEERINLEKANAQLSLAQQRSEMANKAKSAFLANMSHELRTPLNAIIGFAEIMHHKLFGDLSDRYVEYAGNIHGSGNQLLCIIDGVLDFANLESGKLQISETRQSLNAIVDAAMRSVKAQAEKGQVQLSANLPPRPVSLLADEARLTQIIVNLLSNGVKFTPAGGSVAVDAEVDGDGLCISIADTGIGMSPEETEWALEHFRQVDNSFTKRFEGIGLGLPLARQLTELHGGSLSIKSAVGKGTTVSVRLPATRVALDPTDQQRAKDPERSRWPIRNAA